MFSFMRLSGTSPPATSFQNRPLTMFLKNSSVNGLNANILLMENFCFNLVILGLDQNLLIIMSITSKMLNFGSFGHSKHFLLYGYQVKFYYL